MSTQRLSAHAAIQYVRKRKICLLTFSPTPFSLSFAGVGRPKIHPNYGFMKQLIAFGECRYKPSCTSGEYITWKRRQRREVTKYLNLIADTVPIIHDQLYLSRCEHLTCVVQLHCSLRAFTYTVTSLEILMLLNHFSWIWA